MRTADAPSFAQSLSGCDANQLYTLANLLSPTPARGPRSELNGRVTSTLNTAKENLAVGQKKARQLAALLSDAGMLSRFSDPNGAAAPTKGEALSSLVNTLFGCVQLDPPGNLAAAYSPYGAVAFIGPEGGDVITNDQGAAVRVPEGALSGDHLIAITPLLTNTTSPVVCFPTNPELIVVGQCYDFSITPYTTFAVPVRAVICTEPPAGEEGRHNYLQIAKEQHTVPKTVKVYDRVSDPFNLDCDGATLPPALSALDENIFGRAWSRVTAVASAVVKPFVPTKAYAADGVGSDMGDFSHAATVYPIALKTGFELSEGATGWTRTGSWIGSPLIGLTNTAYPSMVDLAPNDASSGALPAPYQGALSMWFGSPATGNYLGTPSTSNPQNGGTSASAHSGVLTSPAFTVPNATNAVRLSFANWWEIESVNPKNFDEMRVLVEDLTAAAPPVSVKYLNPGSDPGTTSSRIPYSNTGFNSAPQWQTVTVDLSAYRGKQVKLHFSFSTDDHLYNGFRGWIVDDVLVRTAPEAVAPPSLLMLQTQQSAKSVAAPTTTREWKP